MNRRIARPLARCSPVSMGVAALCAVCCSWITVTAPGVRASEGDDAWRAASELPPFTRLSLEPVPAVYATLAELSPDLVADPKHAPVLEFARLDFGVAPAVPPAAPLLNEVRVLGVPLGGTCRWVLAARAPEGWLGLIPIGDSTPAPSPPGGPAPAPPSAGICDRPRGTGRPDTSGTFPTALLRVAYEPPGAHAFRVDIMTFKDDRTEGGLDSAFSEDALHCRADARGLACLEERSDRPVAVASIGVQLPATWIGRPGTLYAHYATRLMPAQRMYEAPFDGGVLVFAWHPRRFLAAWQHASKGEWEIDLWPNRLTRPRLELGLTTEADGVVRLSMQTQDDGPGLSLTTTWEELFVPATASRGPLHARITTGMQLHAPSELAPDASDVAGWARLLTVEPGGLRLTESDGPLAWFRGTGAWTWDELVPQVARWRRQAASAIAREAARVLAVRRQRDVRNFEYDRALDLLPGYVEPIGADERPGRTDFFKRPSVVHLDDIGPLVFSVPE